MVYMKKVKNYHILTMCMDENCNCELFDIYRNDKTVAIT